jgi:hypothetical protein
MMQTSRRAMLGAGAAAVLSASLGWAVPAEAVSPARLYRRSRFVPLVGRSWRLVGDTGRWRVTLVDISDLMGAPRGDQGQYRLTFRTSRRGPAQGSYRLVRAGFTDTPMFLVSTDDERRTYQAVVNNI